MNIDWTSLSAGFDESLQKNASKNPFKPVKPITPSAVPVRRPKSPQTQAPAQAQAQAATPAKSILGPAVGYGGMTVTGLGLNAAYNKANQIGTTIGDIMEQGKSLLPMGLSALLSGQKGKGATQGNMMDLLQSTLGAKRNILNYDTMDPRSLTSPSLGYGVPKMAEKKADITDLVSKAMQQRAVNSLIDNALLPPTKENEKPDTDEKALELVTNHPEMSSLLQDEQNKAYLEKLLKESK
jgi:hypothetical protein